MNRSTNYNLYLPESSDYRDVSQLTYNFETLDDVIDDLTNCRDIQKKTFNQLNANGNTDATGISTIPTDAGVYRVTSVIAGLPAGTNGYGTLVVFNGGTYLLYLFADAGNNLYYSRTGSVAAPTAWYKLTGTSVGLTT